MMDARDMSGFRVSYPEPPQQGPSSSSLAELQTAIPRGDTLFFSELCRNPKRTCEQSGRKYLQFSSTSKHNMMFEHETDKIIFRECYEHLAPHIQREMDGHGEKRRGRTAITGTPGIGKTVYGALLVRFYVQRNKSVLYWERDNIYLFSWDPRMKDRFGLKPMLEGEGFALCIGHWQYSENLVLHDIFVDNKDLIFIHDPKENFKKVALMVDKIECIIFILSYKHSLIDWWLHKDLSPDPYFYLPLFSKKEAELCASLLELEGNADDLFKKFGGCFRGWLKPKAMMNEITSTIQKILKENGDDVLRRTVGTGTMRGSVVHMQVDFDPSKPLLSHSHPVENQNQGQDDTNSFQSFHYIFGSEEIMSLFEKGIES